MNKTLKYGLCIIGLLLVIYVGYVVIDNWQLLYPHSKLPYTQEYLEFKVHSDHPIDGDVKAILDSVSYRLSLVSGYRQNVYDIFICYQSETYGFFAKKVGKPQQTQGFNLQPLNHIFIHLPFILEVREKNKQGYRYNILEGSVAHIITHEVCHQLIAEQIGYLKMRNTPAWKLEGFCEYTATKRLKEENDEYQFAKFATNYFTGNFDKVSPGRKFYLRSLLLTEFYLTDKEKSIEDLVEDSISEEKLLKVLRVKYQVGNHQR